MELIQQPGDFWRSYSSFVLADTEKNKGSSKMKFLLMPSLRPLYVILTVPQSSIYICTSQSYYQLLEPAILHMYFRN